MCKRKGERRSRCAIPKNIHGSSRAPTPTDNPSVNFVDSSPYIGEPKVRFTVHKQTLPPLCKGRWHAKHDGGIGAAAESYRKQKTTPQAHSRQLPLHRGAKSRTCFVGGTPVCIKSAQICRGDSRIARSHQSKGGRPMVAPTEWREPCAHRRASPALSPLLPLLLLQSFWKGARGKLLYTKVSPAFFLFYLTFRTPSQARRWRSRDSRSSYPCRSRT